MTTQRPPLEPTLRAARDGGRKLFVPYMTGGLGDDWLDVVRAYAAAGADAIEIGIPFSDPVMDGPVRKHNSVVQFEIVSFKDCFVMTCIRGGPILRIDALANSLE